nr:MAG TPA: hypothetical protein [Caudoviricetes sp.]
MPSRRSLTSQLGLQPIPTAKNNSPFRRFILSGVRARNSKNGHRPDGRRPFCIYRPATMASLVCLFGQKEVTARF